MPYLVLIPGVAVFREHWNFFDIDIYIIGRLMAGFNLKNSTVFACSGS